MKETCTVSKRPREAEEVESSAEDCSKRHKPQNYNHILSLLESEEDEPTQDLSSLITTLHNELNDSSASNSHPPTHQSQQNGLQVQAQAQAQAHTHSRSQCHIDSHSKVDEREEEKDKDRVMILRHLLEASDDELGIPTSSGGDINDGLVDLGFGYDDGLHGEENGYPFCDGLWEFEDENANYYALLQSQLFM